MASITSRTNKTDVQFTHDPVIHSRESRSRSFSSDQSKLHRHAASRRHRLLLRWLQRAYHVNQLLMRLCPDAYTPAMRTRTSNASLIGEIFGTLFFGRAIDKAGRRNGIFWATVFLTLGLVAATGSPWHHRPLAVLDDDCRARFRGLRSWRVVVVAQRHVMYFRRADC